MSNLSVQFLPQELRILDSADLNDEYIPIGTPFDNQICLIKIINTSNVSVRISFDGVTDHDICPSGSFSLYDCTANACREGGLYIPQGTQVYVNGAEGIGLIYLTSFYPGP